MNTKYSNAVKRINAAAAFFALLGYHVTTSFGTCCHSLDVNIFFHKEHLKKHLHHFLSRYANEREKIKFEELTREDGAKFYTLTLSIYIP